MPKPIVYEDIPEFDQETQVIYQLAPVEKDDCIFYGVEIVDVPIQEDEDEENN